MGRRNHSAKRSATGPPKEATTMHLTSSRMTVLGTQFVIALAITLSCAAANPSPSAAEVARTLAFDLEEFDLPTLNAGPAGITAANDGYLYFVQSNVGRPARISTAGAIEEYPAKQGSFPQDIVAGIDGQLWFTETNELASGTVQDRIARLNPVTGVITRFSTPTLNGNPRGIARAPDNSIWFTQDHVGTTSGGVGRLDPASETITEISTSNTPRSLIAGPDNAMWFTTVGSDVVGRVGALGAVTTLGPLPSMFGNLGVRNEIALGPDGALWATTDNFIVRVTANGLFTQYAIPTFLAKPAGITAAQDALWFTESGGNKIGRITVDGLISEYALPNPKSAPMDVTVGSDGAVWFTEFDGDRIGRLRAGSPPVRMKIDLKQFGCPVTNPEYRFVCFLVGWSMGSSGSVGVDARVAIPGGREYRVLTQRRTVRAGATTRARVVFPQAVLVAIDRSLRRGQQPLFRVTVSGRDRAGNSHMVRRTVRIARAK